MGLTLVLALVLAATPAPGGAPTFSSTGLPALPPRPETVAAPADTLVRVPGSPLRLGWSRERASAIGTFKETSNAGAMTVRKGDVRWFGTTSQAVLTFRSGRLASVRLVCTAATPALASYVPDELRRRGYRRVGDEIQSGTETSEWLGPAHVTLAASGKSLIADVASRAVAPAEPDSAAAAAPRDSTSSAVVVAPPPPASAPASSSAPASAAAHAMAAPPDTLPVGALAGEIDFTAPGRSALLPAPNVASTPPPPVRPRIAVDAGIFGRVLVRARVDTTGRVVHATIARGIAEFNSAALAWASEVRFDPYRVNGRLVPVVVSIPVVFARIDTIPPRTHP